METVVIVKDYTGGLHVFSNMENAELFISQNFVYDKLTKWKSNQNYTLDGSFVALCRTRQIDPKIY